MPLKTADNNFGTAKWIVSGAYSDGVTHTTIASALTSASSGDTIFIRTGTYTENLTLKAGVNLTAFECDSSLNATGKVIISGTCTMTTAGSVTISGIQLQTNSAFFLAVTGSAASVVNLNNCYLYCLNNTGISHTSSGAGTRINIKDCYGDIATTGITFFASTATGGPIDIQYSTITNLGNSTTASTMTANNFSSSFCTLNFPITISGTVGGSTIFDTVFNIGGLNTTVITYTSTNAGGGSAERCFIASGSASAISVGAGATYTIKYCDIQSSNANAITGSGTIQYGLTEYSGTSSTINTTTQTILPASAFQKVVVQTFTGNGTYTPTAGMKYCQIECLGGGAGGGGAASGATTITTGGGGGAGSYARKVSTAAAIGASQAVTVGAAANGGTAGANNGTAGNDTSVGAICVGKGGGAGGGAASGTSGAGGLGGVAGTGDFTPTGQPGFTSYNSSATGVSAIGGAGGSSMWGGGGRSPNALVGAVAGNNATNYGSGGSGAAGHASAANVAGGNGSQGLVVITEYV